MEGDPGHGQSEWQGTRTPWLKHLDEYCFHFICDPRGTLQVLSFRKRLAFPWTNVKDTYDTSGIINRKVPSSSPGFSLTLSPRATSRSHSNLGSDSSMAINWLCDLGTYMKL